MLDLDVAARIVRSLAPRLGLLQAGFAVYEPGSGEPRILAIEGLLGGAPHPGGDTVTLPLHVPGPGTIELRVQTADPLGADGRGLLDHLQLTLSELLSGQARALSFSAQIEATLRVLTHDLKSPVNAVTGFVDILFEDYGDSLPAGAGEILQRIRSSAGRLQNLLDGLYRLRQATFTPLRPERVALGDVVRGACARARERHADAASDVTIPEDLPLVFIDADKLEQALGAVVDNAFKFRARDRVLAIDIRYRGTGPGRHEVVVSDTSLGFDPRFREAVLEPFRRLHPPNEYPGAGVGLTIARTCLERLGGSIGLDPTPASGVRAVLTFQEPPAPPEGH